MNKRRKRACNLLIVEGKQEKNELFWLISKCFPELGIEMDNVWIYGTNLYSLYEYITKEYGSGWSRDTIIDIDLPFVISKKINTTSLCYKEDFTNIILIFDYERHDINFSESKIIEMQKYFIDSADMGRLYLNYPMVESYQHLNDLPDLSYSDKKIPVSLQPGKKYKALVRQETVIADFVQLPHKLIVFLCDNSDTEDKQFCEQCIEEILNISDADNIDVQISQILNNFNQIRNFQTAKHYFKNCILKLKYVYQNKSYWKYMREIFQQIIYHNICKANKIQNGEYSIAKDNYKNCFENLELIKILKKQNLASRTESGYIWILNTCVFIVAEYNFVLVEN